ncbi:hypothetical protein JK174_11335 [Acetobacter thailandicus]|nr:hypothetical protein [Acetobacter thailandicus]
MSIEGPEPSPKVIGYHAVIEVGLQTLIAVIMKALDGCFFDRLVHPFHLTAGPWVTEFCQTVFFADHVEAHGRRSRRIAIGFPNQSCDSEFSCLVDGTLTFSGLDFRHIKMLKTQLDSI